MKYIKTKDGIFELNDVSLHRHSRVYIRKLDKWSKYIGTVDNIEELCDEFVIKNTKHFSIAKFLYSLGHSEYADEEIFKETVNLILTGEHWANKCEGKTPSQIKKMLYVCQDDWFE